MNSHIIGMEGESEAQSFLESKRYQLIKKNFRSKFGEIDLIMKDIKNNMTVFVEVKYYQENAVVPPEYMITQAKRKKIIKTALFYISKTQNHDDMYRFDLVIVKHDHTFNHLEHIFTV